MKNAMAQLLSVSARRIGSLKVFFPYVFLLAIIFPLRPFGGYREGFVLIAVYVQIILFWELLLFIYRDSNAQKLIVFYFINLIIFMYGFTRTLKISAAPDAALYTALCFLIFLLPVFLTSQDYPKSRKFILIISKFFYILFFIVGLFLSIGYISFGLCLTPETMIAAMLTNRSELIEYIKMTVPIWAILLLVLLSVASIYFSIKIHNCNFNSSKDKFKTTIFILIVLLVALSFQKIDKSYSEIINIINAPILYKNELAKFHEMRDFFTKKNIVATKDTTGELHIVIIGESSNKNMYSAYGYHNDTTPWLRDSTAILYKNAYSCHTHTTCVFSLAFTKANQYNRQNYFESETLIGVLKAAGFHTEWLSNQVLYGSWDNLVTALAAESDYLESINKYVGPMVETFFPDQKLVPLLQARLKKRDVNKNTFVVIHLMGNHANYADRIKGLHIELPKLSKLYYAGREDEAYDKSIRNVDILLSQIYDIVSKEKGFMTMTYLSDHGEDPVMKKGHDASHFTPEMLEIPLLFWLSDAYSARYPHKAEHLVNHRNAVFTNDLLYDTLLGLYDIKTAAYDDTWDLSSQAFQLKEPKAIAGTWTGPCKISLLPRNTANRNLASIPDAAERIMAHRTNTIGAFDDAVKLGFKSIEVDLFFDAEKNRFKIGHTGNPWDTSTNTNDLFEDYLTVTKGAFTRIWLDIKNVFPNNADAVLQELNRLDAQFNLKPRAIVETALFMPDFSIFYDAGWHNSYYMPTAVIEELMKKSAKPAEIQSFVNQFKEQMKHQRIHAISFDSRLYPFVKMNIEPIISPSIVYHTWSELDPTEENFLQNIKNSPLFNDTRIKTIILKSPSPFIL